MIALVYVYRNHQKLESFSNLENYKTASNQREREGEDGEREREKMGIYSKELLFVYRIVGYTLLLFLFCFPPHSK